MAGQKCTLLLILLASLALWQTSSASTLGLTQLFKSLATMDTRVRALDFWRKLVLWDGEDPNEPTRQEMLDKINSISSQIGLMNLHLTGRIAAATTDIPLRVRADAKIDRNVRDLITAWHRIDFLYDTYLNWVLKNPHDQKTLKDFVENVLASDEGAMAVIYKIYRILQPDRTSNVELGLIGNLMKKLEAYNLERCDDEFSPQQWLFNIYVNVMVSESRAFMLSMLAYEIDSETSGASHNAIMRTVTREYITRTDRYITLFRNVMSTVPRDIRRCDPPNAIRGQTFVEFERMIQPVLLNEDQLPPFYEKGFRWCRSERLGIYHHVVNKTQKHLQEDRIQGTCSGTADCRNSYRDEFYYGASGCAMPEWHKKRYIWVARKFGNFSFGDIGNCDGGESSTAHVHDHYESQADPAAAVRSCFHAICMCHGNDEDRALRKIGVREQMADWKNNRVVTGIRLVLQDKILKLQIKEGKLIAGGKIDPETVRWVPLEKIERDGPRLWVTDVKNGEQVRRPFSLGQDYEDMSDMQYRMLLNDTILPNDHVIVGLGFKKLEYRFGHNHDEQWRTMILDVRMAPFNWTTGELGTPYNFISAGMHKLDIEKLMRNTPEYSPNYDEDSLKPVRNLPMRSNQFILFTPTNMQREFGQSVVPYWDTLPLETNPPTPLGGIGFIQKAQPGYGGFITPHIFNVNFVNYMDYKRYLD